MPPKRARKGTDTESDVETPKTKRSKAKKQEETENTQPTNKVLPVHISFPPKHLNCLRVATWNICGLAASQKKGFKHYVEAEDPDVLILTETKVNEEPVDPNLKSRFPHQYWSISDKKSYSGVAILSRHKALAVTKTLPGHPDPTSVKGRIITVEFEKFYVIGTYVVNAGMGLKTMDAKKEWNLHFEQYIRDLDKKKSVIWTGDLNVAPTEMDLANAKKNWNKTAGYTEPETTSFKNILHPPEAEGPQFVDIWRQHHPKDRQYTYFSYRFNCRAKGIGWRLDMFVLSERLVDQVKMCEIRGEIYGASDHCPVVLEMEAQLGEQQTEGIPNSEGPAFNPR